MRKISLLMGMAAIAAVPVQTIKGNNINYGKIIPYSNPYSFPVENIFTGYKKKSRKCCGFLESTRKKKHNKIHHSRKLKRKHKLKTKNR
jgi:hypothetical protein